MVGGEVVDGLGVLAEQGAAHAVPVSGAVVADEEHAGLTQDPQVLRDRRLCQVTVLDDLLDDVRSADGELPEDADPLRMGEGASDQGDALVREGRRRRQVALGAGGWDCVMLFHGGLQRHACEIFNKHVEDRRTPIGEEALELLAVDLTAPVLPGLVRGDRGHEEGRHRVRPPPAERRVHGQCEQNAGGQRPVEHGEGCLRCQRP